MDLFRRLKGYLASSHIPVLFGLRAMQDELADPSALDGAYPSGPLYSTYESTATTEHLEHNCIELESFNPFIKRYLFVDSTQLFSEGLFERAGVPVRVFGRMRVFDNARYTVVQCRVNRKHIAAFMKVLADLERKVLLCGYGDYLEYCRKLKLSLHEHGPGLTFF